MDDLADIILDVWNEADAHTEERFIKLIDDYKGKPDFTLENLKSLIQGGKHD